MNWVITIPKTVPWSEYKKELDAVADRVRRRTGLPVETFYGKPT